MEDRVRERLVGALVLVGIVVLLVPAILTGGADRRASDPATDSSQSVEIRLAPDTPATETDVLVPEPETVPAHPNGATAAAVSPPSLAIAPTIEPRPAPQPAALEAATPEKPRPAGTTRATTAPQERPAWAVQLGAFSSREKAERLVAELRGRGYAAFVLEYRASGQVLHRVRVGPEQDRSRAVAVAERLRKDGFQPVVAPHP